MLRALSVIATLTVVTTPMAMAQGTGCEDAAVRVGASALPRAGSPDWNDWVTLTGCGSRGATVIGSVLRSDAVRTETELTRVDQLAGMLDGWFQPTLVSAYEWLLRAPDASNAMKLRAMWLLSGLYVPEVDVAGPLQGYMSARCETYQRTTDLRDAPNTLPAEAYDQAVAAVDFAAADRMAPEYVRTTAQCWSQVIRDGLANGTREVNTTLPVADRTVVVEQPPVIVEHPVRVVYECGTRFVLYNDYGSDLAVRYSGYGSGVLRVRHGGPFVWVAARFGPVRFWVGDREVWYTTAVYRPCGPRVMYAPAIYPWADWHVGLGVFVSSRTIYPRPVRPVVIVNRPVRPVVVVNRPARPVVVVNRPPRPVVIVNGGGHNRPRGDDGWNRPRGDRPGGIDRPNGGGNRPGGDRPNTGGDRPGRDGNGDGQRGRDGRGYGYQDPRGGGGGPRTAGGGGPATTSGGGGPSRTSGGAPRVAVPKAGGGGRVDQSGYHPRPTGRPERGRSQHP